MYNKRMKQATPNIRTIDHADHTDIERLFYVYSLDNGKVSRSAVWAVVWCGVKQEKQVMTEATYKFEYAIRRLRDAINYSEQERDYAQIRIWVSYVEAAYKADIAAEKELTANASEGAKLLHSVAMNGEQSVLSRLDNSVDAVDAQQWRDDRCYESASSNHISVTIGNGAVCIACGDITDPRTPAQIDADKQDEDWQAQVSGMRS